MLINYNYNQFQPLLKITCSFHYDDGLPQSVYSDSLVVLLSK